MDRPAFKQVSIEQAAKTVGDVCGANGLEGLINNAGGGASMSFTDGDVRLKAVHLNVPTEPTQRRQPRVRALARPPRAPVVRAFLLTGVHLPMTRHRLQPAGIPVHNGSQLPGHGGCHHGRAPVHFKDRESVKAHESTTTSIVHIAHRPTCPNTFVDTRGDARLHHPA